jgi:hypothetical protein
VVELVRHAVEVCDPEDREQGLGRFEEQLEDDDEPITTVENLEERLALAAEGADYEIEDPRGLGRHGGGPVPRGQTKQRRRYPRPARTDQTRRQGAVAPRPPDGRRRMARGPRGGALTNAPPVELARGGR